MRVSVRAPLSAGAPESLKRPPAAGTPVGRSPTCGLEQISWSTGGFKSRALSATQRTRPILVKIPGGAVVRRRGCSVPVRDDFLRRQIGRKTLLLAFVVGSDADGLVNPSFDVLLYVIVNVGARCIGRIVGFNHGR